MMERIPGFVNSRIRTFFWCVEILNSEKSFTVMHEAIVAQLHPQDQRFLPGSAVPLHQRTQEREDAVEKGEGEHSKKKMRGENVEVERERTKNIVCLEKCHTHTPPTPLFLHPIALRPAEPLHAPS